MEVQCKDLYGAKKGLVTGNPPLDTSYGIYVSASKHHFSGALVFDVASCLISSQPWLEALQRHSVTAVCSL